MKNQYAKEMLKFIDKSPTNFHAVNNVKNILLENGYVELLQNNKWIIEKNKSYFVINEDSSLIAIKTGSGDIVEDGLNIIGAHTDYPCLKIKPNTESIVVDHLVKLNVEMYGGAITSTWFDRGLSIAGKVVLKDQDNKNEVKTKLLKVEKTLLTIPSLAIHLSRDKEAKPINIQTDMQPLLSIVKENFEKDDYLVEIIKNELNCQKDDILDFELFIYDNQNGEIFGLNDEFLQSRALDDLYMVYAGLTALLESNESSKTNILILTDNEEVGSNTATGARSVFVENTLERLFLSFNKNREELFIGFHNSMCLSADLAHSYHINYESASDITNKPVLSKGIVVKKSANKSYSTESTSFSKLKLIFENDNIPYQLYVNRSDIKGGSTIGPMLSQKFGISAIDIGAPILGMHSVRETGSVSDVENSINAFKAFYNR